MRTSNARFAFCFIIAALFALALCAWGQGTNGKMETAPLDATIKGFFDHFSGWKFILVPVVLLCINGVKFLVPKIPSNLFPFAAPIIGGLLDYAAMKAGFWTSSGEVGVIMGALATWFHQAGRQTVELVNERRVTAGAKSDNKPAAP